MEWLEKIRPYRHHKRILMTKGNELRERHIDYLLKQLNTVINATIFQYKSIKT